MAKFEAAIEAVNIRGARPRREDRRTIEAIIWRIDNGAKWRLIPAESGDWHHAYLRFRRWTVRGVWDKIMAHLAEQGEPQLAFACIDATIARTSEGVRGATRPGCGQRPWLRVRRIRGVASDGEALGGVAQGSTRASGWNGNGGRSRGGLGTKIVGVCDAAARLVDFLLAPGQAHELAPFLTLLRRLPKAPSWAIADMACDAAQFRSAARAMGVIPVVPSRRGAKAPQPCPAFIYRHRNQIERCWSRLKERRAVATRHDKTAASYAAGVAIAASINWIKSLIR